MNFRKNELGLNKYIVTKFFMMGFSVVIPTYEQRGHGAAMLTALLSSITRLRHPGGDFELLVCDNSENQDIRNVVDKFNDILGCGVFYLRNSRHKGAAENINFCIDHAAHDKVKIMCMDDLFINPSALTMTSAALDSNGWVICDSRIANQDGIMGRTARAKFIPGHFERNTVGMPSCIAFNKCHVRMDPSLKTFCDLWFYHELYLNYGKPYHIQTPIVAQRYWSGSQSRNQPATHAKDSEIMKKRYNAIQKAH